MKFLCLAFGSEKDWNALSKVEQADLLARDDVLRSRGAVVAAVGTEFTTVRAWAEDVSTADVPSGGSLPLAGFCIVEARDVDEVVRLVWDTPCSRAKGAVEIYRIDQINEPAIGRRA
jgi:hypothetical protein